MAGGSGLLHRTSRRWFAGSGILVLALSVPASLGAEQPCPDDLLRSAPAGKDPRYQAQGDHCEGFYAEPRSADLLSVVGVSYGYPTTLPAESPVSITWQAPGAGEDRSTDLHALALRAGFFYRMDALRIGGRRSFDWPQGLVRKALDRAANVRWGFTVVKRGLVSEVGPEVYLPVDSPTEPTDGGKYPLVFTLIAHQAGLSFESAEVHAVATSGQALRPIATGVRAVPTYDDGTWSNPIPPNEAFRLSVDRALLEDQPGPVLQLAVRVKTEAEPRNLAFYFFHPGAD